MKSLALQESFSYIVSIADSDITPPIKHIYIYFEIKVWIYKEYLGLRFVFMSVV